VFPRTTFELPLTAVTKAAFEEQGFATVPRITSDEELAWLRRVYDRLLMVRLDAAKNREGGIQGRANNTLWISLDKSETLIFEHTSLLRNARKVAGQVLEEPGENLSVGVRFFFKPGRGGGAVPWHQDEAHKDPAFDHRSVNVWVPLEPATEANGCLWYIPSSHRGEVRVHRHPGHGAPEVALVTDELGPGEKVPVPLSAAGASIHHCRTVHASGPNLTNDHRRAVAIVCGAEPRRRTRPAERPWLRPEHIEIPGTSF
jgi:hypothetical protein